MIFSDQDSYGMQIDFAEQIVIKKATADENYIMAIFDRHSQSFNDESEFDYQGRVAILQIAVKDEKFVKVGDKIFARGSYWRIYKPIFDNESQGWIRYELKKVDGDVCV